MNNKKQILEGSHAVAEIVKNLRPGVVAAYPITPQTHIVEDLAKMKDNGEAVESFKFLLLRAKRQVRTFLDDEGMEQQSPVIAVLGLNIDRDYSPFIISLSVASFAGLSIGIVIVVLIIGLFAGTLGTMGAMGD